MANNTDPFTYQFGPMTPAGSVSSQRGQGAPPLPPRPHIPRRPVPTPGSSSSSSPFPASPTQSPQFRGYEGYPPSPVQPQPPPTYNVNPPEDPSYTYRPSPAYNYGYSPPAEASASARAPPTYNYRPPEAGFPPNPPAVPPQGAPEPQEKRHSSFSSGLKKLAKVAFLESLSPGLSFAMAADTPAAPAQPQAAPNMGMPMQSQSQQASYPGMPGGQVIVNGVTLGPADLQTLQSALGTVIPGNYWYDPMSGAYGTVGGPCTGFLAAGPALGGGALAPDASGRTGTGVYINGREIHPMDVTGLQQMGATVMPGRWWVRADGSYGAEGSAAVLGNLRIQAGAASYAYGGQAKTWGTSQGHFGGTDGQGFTYIGGPGWTYYSG